MLEVRSTGALTSIQDAGRHGLRCVGVPSSGVLDHLLMRIANRLVGNPDTDPVIECFDGGQSFCAIDTSLRLALAGNVTAEISRPGAVVRAQPAWQSFMLAPGETLKLSGMRSGRIAVIAVAGLDPKRVLGSASAYARAHLGDNLRSGDRLQADPADVRPERILPDPPQRHGGAIRIVPGPQQDHFTTDALATLTSSEYRVSEAADRMGMRLAGPTLTHEPAFGHEIVSDATIPGAIQVPGHGLPIVLLADAQTAGGYPKIATVVSADLPRLATLRPGERVRFVTIDALEGERLAREASTLSENALARIRELAIDGPDLDALYSTNLVDGMIDALSPDASTATAEKGRSNGNEPERRPR